MKRCSFILTGALTGLLCGVILSLTACDLGTPWRPSVSASEEQKEDISSHITFFTDPVTGVQYIVYREKFYNAGFGGITPRLHPDGSLYVVENGGVQNADIRTIS